MLICGINFVYAKSSLAKSTFNDSCDQRNRHECPWYPRQGLFLMLPVERSKKKGRATLALPIYREL
jgi:hypothetical protein